LASSFRPSLSLIISDSLSITFGEWRESRSYVTCPSRCSKSYHAPEVYHTQESWICAFESQSTGTQYDQRVIFDFCFDNVCTIEYRLPVICLSFSYRWLGATISTSHLKIQDRHASANVQKRISIGSSIDKK